MTRDNIRNEYFEWLCGLVCDGGHIKQSSYNKLLMHLHNTEFTYTIRRDENRLSDGLNLRYRFATAGRYHDIADIYVSYLDYLDDPCSVLEMMVALSLRCEENIMDDPESGNRTGQWFWGMVVNLGLGHMDNSRFDKDFANEVLTTFLNRNYAPDGKGGLFTVKYSPEDLRDVEIWYQMCWYLDQLI